jgi:hypothetical protein
MRYCDSIFGALLKREVFVRLSLRASAALKREGSTSRPKSIPANQSRKTCQTNGVRLCINFPRTALRESGDPVFHYKFNSLLDSRWRGNANKEGPRQA